MTEASDAAGAATAPVRRVVYTALVGGYEEMLDQPVARASALDFICFTDDPELRSEDWEVRVVDRVLPGDRIRSARALKIAGHHSLAVYDESLWIDNRVRLTADPAEILDEWLSGADLAVPQHSYRADVVSEFQAVLDLGLDDSSRLYEQLSHYAALAPDLLRHPAPWTGMLARRRTPAVDAAMEQWLRHVLRYSRRDQLSFVHALREAGLEWRSVDISHLSSPLHEWRAPAGRSARSLRFQIADSLQPPTAELGQLRISYEQSVQDLASAVREREQAIAALQSQLDAELEAHRAKVAAAEQDDAAHRATVDAAEQELTALRALRSQDLARIERLRRKVRRVRRKKRRVERELARATAPWRPWRRR